MEGKRTEVNAIGNAETEEKRTASVKSKAVFVLLLCYSALVLWYTVFMRSTDFYGANYDFFWSYYKWFAGDWTLGWQILGNIGMFIPFGFMLTTILPLNTKSWLAVLFFGVLFSCIIEILQLELMRGLFEYDDIFNNTLGTVLGYLAYRLLQHLSKGKYTDYITFSLGCLFVVTGMLFCIDGNNVTGKEINNVPRNICLQVDKAVLEDNRLMLTGFAFGCNQVIPVYSLTLKSTKTGKELKADTECGLLRQDMARYFNSQLDYARCGYTAAISGFNVNEEYEIFINLKRFVSFPAGVFITGTDIHYTKQDGFIVPEVEGTALEEIVSKGYLRVYRPDRACYVYQYKGYLYWLADTGFHFENNGKTYMQYQLWTTQTEKLPQKRLKNHWYWDNIGDYFERHEITNLINCGRYRVCKRKLPEEYSITAIVTGYYKNDKWIWKNYFRPVYEF